MWNMHMWDESTARGLHYHLISIVTHIVKNDFIFIKWLLNNTYSIVAIVFYLIVETVLSLFICKEDQPKQC